MVSRHSDQMLAEALALGTATLFEASGISTTAVDRALRSIWMGACVAGPAYPLECSPGDNLAIHVGMDRAPRGSVLIVSCGGFVAGYWGEVLTAAAEAAGIVGLVIDGGVRDTAALAARAFPTFARGISVKGTIKSSVPSVGLPIDLAGTPVAPGDLVVADDDGVVILPADQAADIVKRGRARADKETVMMAELRDGKTTLELLGLTEWRLA